MCILAATILMCSDSSVASRPVGSLGVLRSVARCLLPVVALACVSDIRPVVARTGAPDWAAWSNAVDAHVPGQKDAALAAIAAWSRNDLEALAPLMSRELERLAPAEQWRRIGRALVLHTDIPILNRTSNGYSLPPTGTATVLSRDGNIVGQMAGTFHWEFMRRVLGRLPDSDDRRRVSRTFFRATAAELEQWGEYPELTLHLSAARTLLNDDPVLLMYEGTMHQAYAAPRTQRFFAERRRAQSSGRPIITATSNPNIVGNPSSAPLMERAGAAIPAVGSSREQAARMFQRALSLDPSLVEARIRLAQVRGDQGQHETALAEIARATSRRLTPFLDYFAALIAGREHRAMNQLDAARASFEHARRIQPDATPPRYGLSELALARGDADQARELLVGLAIGPGDVDLWWGRIDRVHDPSAQTLLHDMRRALSP